jgi:hypothetical protein
LEVRETEPRGLVKFGIEKKEAIHENCEEGAYSNDDTVAYAFGEDFDAILRRHGASCLDLNG